MKLRKAIDYYHNQIDVSERTQGTYREANNHFLHNVGNCAVSRVRPEHVRKWRNEMQAQTKTFIDHPLTPVQNKPLSVFSIRRRMTSVRTTFRWFVREGMIKRSPFENVKIPPKPHPTQRKVKAIKGKDYRLMLGAAKRGASPCGRDEMLYIARDTAILTYLRVSAGRLGGLVGLTYDNVFDDGEYIMCRVLEKRNIWHERHLTPAASLAMRTWIELSPKSKTGRVFYALEGKNAHSHLLPGTVYTICRRKATQAGIVLDNAIFNPQGFRHGWAIKSIETGTELAIVANVLGHSSPAVTYEFYGVHRPENRRGMAMTAMSRWLAD